MNTFNAAEARALVQNKDNVQLDSILREIKKRARQGVTVLRVYNAVHKDTVLQLKEKGFRVEELPNIPYYSIYWD